MSSVERILMWPRSLGEFGAAVTDSTSRCRGGCSESCTSDPCTVDADVSPSLSHSSVVGCTFVSPWSCSTMTMSFCLVILWRMPWRGSDASTYWQRSLAQFRTSLAK
eukprot:7380996-Prymnesium_polylepis.3